jgi:hypothetical protein
MAPAEASGTAVDSTFAEAENYGVGIDHTSVIAADFDGAGGMDLTVANQGSDDFSVLLNENDGTFGRFIEYGSGVSPSSVDVADFDGDGHPDLAVANQGTAGTSFAISVLTNEGDGTFGGAANYAVGIFPSSVIAADLGGDDASDIAVANANTGTISILLNRGDGTFEGATDHEARVNPIAVTAGDLDGDTDLAVVNDSPDNRPRELLEFLQQLKEIGINVQFRNTSAATSGSVPSRATSR